MSAICGHCRKDIMMGGNAKKSQDQKSGRPQQKVSVSQLTFWRTEEGESVLLFITADDDR